MRIVSGEIPQDDNHLPRAEGADLLDYGLVGGAGELQAHSHVAHQHVREHQKVGARRLQTHDQKCRRLQDAWQAIGQGYSSANKDGSQLSAATTG